MNLFVHHDAAALARLVGMSAPCCNGVMLAHPPRGDALASFVDGNPLSDDFLIDVELPGRRIVLWSGTLADELFGDDPRTWMVAGRDAFRRFCDAAAPTLVARDRVLCFRPHVRHVLSDVPSCVSFLRERQGQPFEVALSPADLLTRAMLGDVEDHVTRAFEALGPLASIVLLHDAVPDESPECDVHRPVPLGRGVLPASLIVELLRRHVPATTPVVLAPGELDRQCELLGTRSSCES
ncbi:MAG: hypothetical protein U0572_02040 [Phycisphaerales bacterium]